MDLFYAFLIMAALVLAIAIYLGREKGAETPAKAAWTREQKTGAAVALAVGAVTGAIVGYGHREDRYLELSGWLANDGGEAVLWAVIGAFLAGAAIYAYRVFSKTT
ncbi:MAG: hypothetical protein JOY77_05090 [Alphaproteobacteria bacterium]|nr:hypothetical protein [Alphaproteobacteria bacterium]MBV9062290.1 hypothetical protein [Alphaproteobacteria bacterium]